MSRKFIGIQLKGPNLISLAVLSKSLKDCLDCKARLDLATLRGSDLDGCSACPNCPLGPEPAVGWQS